MSFLLRRSGRFFMLTTLLCILSVAAALSSCATAASDYEADATGENPASASTAGEEASASGKEGVSIESLGLGSLQKGNLEIEAEPENALISVNGRERGETPLVLALNPGSYRVEAEADGYEQKTVWIRVETEAEKRISFELKRITGTFAPSIDPASAEVFVEDQRIGELPVELPVGIYRVRVYRFGYRPWEKRIAMEEGVELQPEIRLEPAEPSLSALALSRRRIHPEAGGPIASTRVSFEINGPAELRVKVRDSEGNLVHERKIPARSAPKQTFIWPEAEEELSATGGDGAPARYTLEIYAAFPEGPELTEEIEVLIDRRMSNMLTVSPWGKEGSLLCSYPPGGGAQSHVGFGPMVFLEDYEDDEVPIHFPSTIYLSARTSHYRSVSASVGVDIRTTGSDDIFTAGEAKTLLFGKFLPSWFRSSAAVSAVYHAAHRRRSIPPSTGIGLSLPGRIGGEVAGIVFEPLGRVRYIGDEIAASGGTAAALALQGGGFSSALSASIEYDSVSPGEPVLKTAAELHFLLPKTDYKISVYGAADLSDAPDAYSAGGGIVSSVVK